MRARVRLRTRIGRQRERLRRIGARGRPKRFVFIVTYGRTGSTLLQKLLNTIDRVYVAGENHGVMRGLFEAWRNARETREHYSRASHTVDDPWYGAMLVDPDAFARQLGDVFVSTILKPPRGKSIVGFKEIRYLKADLGGDLAEQLDFMAQVFQPATFIFNRRDVGAVSRSAFWREEDPIKLARDVAEFDAVTDAYVAARPDACVKLDYDEWTRDPEALRPVYTMLGEKFDLETVDRVLGVRLDHLKG